VPGPGQSLSDRRQRSGGTGCAIRGDVCAQLRQSASRGCGYLQPSGIMISSFRLGGWRRAARAAASPRFDAPGRCAADGSSSSVSCCSSPCPNQQPPATPKRCRRCHRRAGTERTARHSVTGPGTALRLRLEPELLRQAGRSHTASSSASCPSPPRPPPTPTSPQPQPQPRLWPAAERV
jgi:hypothetical protein